MALERTIREAFDEAYVPEPNSGCWLWMRSLGSHGYGVIWRADQKLQLAHRFSYERARGSVPFGLKVLHRCDVRCCVNPDHLFVGTDADNHRDMARKERGTQKLSAKDVRNIRSDSRHYTVVAKEYGIHPSAAHQIKRRQQRKYIDEGNPHGP